MEEPGERSPLLGPPPGPRRANTNRLENGDMNTVMQLERRRTSLICMILFGLGCMGLVGAVVICHSQFLMSTIEFRTDPLFSKSFLLSQDQKSTQANSIPLRWFGEVQGPLVLRTRS